MRFEIHVATAADDAGIRRLLRREPMPGRIRLTYEREPEFSRGCEITGEDCRVLVACPEGSAEVVGMASRSVRRMFVNGREQRLGYLGNLRIDSRCRGRWLISRGFAEMKEWHNRDPLPGYLASIIAENPEARGVLVEKRRKGFPAFNTVAEYQTLAVALQRRRHRRVAAGGEPLSIRPSRTEDFAELASFLQAQGRNRQFFSVWTEKSLQGLSAFGLKADDFLTVRRRGGIAGVAALWDQSAYKQTVVRGYSGWLRAFSPLYNLGAPWTGRPALPKAGDKLLCAYAALICVADDDLDVFRELLQNLYELAHARRHSHMLIGLDSRDPLLPVAREYPHLLYSSRLYLADWSADSSNGGRLYEQLDRRPAYVDIATL